eukprot:7369061-Prymnesium_polylepis.1
MSGFGRKPFRGLPGERIEQAVCISVVTHAGSNRGPESSHRDTALLGPCSEMRAARGNLVWS